MSISDDMLAAMREQAKGSSGGGTYIILDEPGEFVAGIVTGLHEEETSFGPVEELSIKDVRTKYGNQEGERRLRLSRSVLQRELGSQAEKGPAKVGQAVYVEYHGEATSKQGRQFHRYSVMKWDEAPTQPTTPTVQDAKAVVDSLKENFGASEVKDEDIPF